ncbi:putative ATP synthase subunit f, mitochondrial [Venturia canescens]|uniref:putative ATP synthase subunit f, mitochondrial n=1 Tax=Venturia canescens TaxID=32260 RepID=UPI001C9D009C|nr:putative ATP synthase subunit f, mitochondrial [Venturia canescens]
MAEGPKINIGLYPPEYNRALHGPYDPARYYGKPDTPFGEVKLGELIAWFGRRQKTPSSLAGLISRAWWRWQHAYILPKRTGIAPFAQFTCAGMAFFYYLNYDRIKHHKNYKYH